jgi:polyvinyl alcohol dehydrogenase (cytochrome)
VVFVGASDGHLRAYRANDGAVIWDFDTAGRSYDAVNSGSARGGLIDNGGPVAAGGMLLVNSGYGRQLAHAGNALFAFTPDGR